MHRHSGGKRKAGTAHEPGETKCEMEKCHQWQTFARNIFIQLLGDCCKARTDNKDMRVFTRCPN